MQDDTHFLVVRGAKQPEPASGTEYGPRPRGPWGSPGPLPFLEFVEDAGSLLSVLFWCDLSVGEQPIDGRKPLPHGLL